MEESKSARTGRADSGVGLRSAWIVSALALAVAAPAGSEPAIAFAGEQVLASGLAPGGSAVWFGVARELGEDGGTTVVVRRSVATDGNGDGTVAYELGAAPALRSLWTAADLASGQVGVGTLDGVERGEIPPEEVALVAEQADRLWVGREVVELVVLRAGVGAWALTVGDGGAGDLDAGVEVQVEAGLSSFAAVGEGTPAPPTAYQAGDVVVIVDSHAMQIYVGRVEAAEAEVEGDLVLVPVLAGAA